MNRNLQLEQWLAGRADRVCEPGIWILEWPNLDARMLKLDLLYGFAGSCANLIFSTEEDPAELGEGLHAIRDRRECHTFLVSPQRISLNFVSWLEPQSWYCTSASAVSCPVWNIDDFFAEPRKLRHAVEATEADFAILPYYDGTPWLICVPPDRF